MRKFPLLSLALGAAVTVTWLSYDQPEISATEPLAAEVDEALKPVDVNMHDLMEGMFQLPYRRLKTAMEKEPTDPPAWKAMRSDALILAEASNLLILRKPETDVPAWVKYSVDSRDAGAEIVKAAKKQDFAASKAAYIKMLDHCNGCHKQFEKGKHMLKP